MGTYRKMKTFKKKRSGFTVIELMIVVVIVGILVALAFPSYVQYVRKAKRGEAQQLLLNWAINQEIWRSNNISYAGLGDLAAPTHDHYNFDTNGVDPTATVYTLRAIGQGDQTNDVSRDGTPCTTLRLTQAGEKLEAACWD